MLAKWSGQQGMFLFQVNAYLNVHLRMLSFWCKCILMDKMHVCRTRENAVSVWIRSSTCKWSFAATPQPFCDMHVIILPTCAHTCAQPKNMKTDLMMVERRQRMDPNVFVFPSDKHFEWTSWMRIVISSQCAVGQDVALKLIVVFKKAGQVFCFC